MADCDKTCNEIAVVVGVLICIWLFGISTTHRSIILMSQDQCLYHVIYTYRIVKIIWDAFYIRNRIKLFFFFYNSCFLFAFLM